MLAFGKSILLIATIIGHFAAFAWFIASTVWSFTLSSAATTNTTKSVIFDPLARIWLKAACPGVSKKVIFPFSESTIYAPICCVIPPASD